MMNSFIAKMMLGSMLFLGIGSAFAVEVPANLVGTWKEINKNTDPDILVINSDKSISWNVDYQVSRGDGKILSTTTCYFKVSGRITEITPHGEVLYIGYLTDNMELIEPTHSSTMENCMAFIHEWHRGDVFAITLVALDKNTLQDTWLATIYKRN